MKFLILPASLRRDSVNRKLAAIVARRLKEIGSTPDLRDFADFDMPLYNGDIETESGLPEGARKLAAAIRANDAVILISPEYNYSIPGVLKNAIDWVSRERPTNALKHVPLQLMSASPAEPGGIRGLWHLRQPLEGNFAHVHSPMFALAKAHEAFNDDGSLKNEKLNEMLNGMLDEFIAFAGALRG